MKDLISVIIPVYNVDKYLERCIDSVIVQTYSNLEIILVDDGSNDDSGIICDRYAKFDDRIKVIHKKNGGVSSARNEGIKYCNGKYIGFVDSDDYIDSTMYEYLYNLLISNDADISCCDFFIINEGKNIGNYKKNNIINIYDNELALKELLRGKKINDFVWNKLYKRELFNNISFLDNKTYEDIAIMYRLIDKSNLVACSDIKLYKYLVRNTSLTNSFKKNNILDYDEMIKLRYNDLLDKYPNMINDLDANKIKFIVRQFQNISMFKRKDLLSDNCIKRMFIEYLQFLKECKKCNFRYINDFKVNIMFNLLIVNVNLFFVFTDLYYMIKMIGD